MTLPLPPKSVYAFIMQKVEDDGVVLSGLNEWNAKADFEAWANIPENKAIIDKWKHTTTKEQRECERQEWVRWYEIRYEPVAQPRRFSISPYFASEIST